VTIARSDFTWDEFFWKARLDIDDAGRDGPVDVVFADVGRG
jgi:hypothetical protein